MKFSKLEAFRGGKPIVSRWWSILVDLDSRLSALENGGTSNDNSNSNSNDNSNSNCNDNSNSNSNDTSNDNSNSNSNDNSNESQQPQSPTTRTLSFTINDGTNAIDGASVTIDSTTKTTGSAGGCTFTDMADGTYSVEVSKEGYTTKTESITSDETHTSFTISLVSA